MFWVGAVLSNSGSWMQNIAVPFVVFEITGSPTMVGVATFAQLVPIVICGPVGGHLADRFPRRKVLLVTQALAAVEAVALWVLWWRGASLVPLLAMVVVGGVIAGVNIPSWQAFISELVPRDVLLNAVTLNSTQFNASRAVGPMVGGVVIAAFGPGAAFGINAVSFTAIIGALWMIRLAPPTPRHVQEQSRRRIVGDFMDAARATRGFPGIRACFIAVVALGALGGPLWSLLVVFAQKVFYVGAEGYGMLQAALGIGSVVAAPFIAGPGTRARRSRLLLVAMFAYGACLMAFAATSWYPVALVALIMASAGYLGIASALNTTIQLQVPEAIRGKVLALYVMLLTLAIPVGALVQGAAADRVGAPLTVLVAGAGFVVATVWLWLGSGLLAHIDDEGPPPEEHPQSEVAQSRFVFEEGPSFGTTGADGAPAAGSTGALVGGLAAMEQTDESLGPITDASHSCP